MLHGILPPRSSRSFAWSRPHRRLRGARWHRSASPKPTFYAWYERYIAGGMTALEDRKPRPRRVWNRIADDERQQVLELALDEPEHSPREVAVTYADRDKTFIFEASVIGCSRAKVAQLGAGRSGGGYARRAVIEAQDPEISGRSGHLRSPIKSIGMKPLAAEVARMRAPVGASIVSSSCARCRGSGLLGLGAHADEVGRGFRAKAATHSN
jgi:homeodomain-containing protein